MNETNNISGRCHENYLAPSLRNRAGKWRSEPANRWSHKKSYCPTNNNETPINKHRIRFTLRVEPI